MEYVIRQSGLLCSILIHVVILLIPISFQVTSHFSEIELFVTGDVARVETRQIKHKEMKLPVIKETVPFNEPRQIRVPEETPVVQEKLQEIIETAAAGETPSSHRYPPFPEVEAASAGTPQPQVTFPNIPASPMDTDGCLKKGGGREWIGLKSL